jgi:hypothetical protein
LKSKKRTPVLFIFRPKVDKPLAMNRQSATQALKLLWRVVNQRLRFRVRRFAPGGVHLLRRIIRAAAVENAEIAATVARSSCRRRVCHVKRYACCD